MAKLIYSMLTSLDGYTEDANGKFGWGAAESEELHSFIAQLGASVGAYLYGRRMYETMVFWETAHEGPNPPQVLLEYARHWQSVDKIVYSRTLDKPRSARTRIEREFDPAAVRKLKAEAKSDFTVDGPELAAHALRADLVDELQMFICPVVVGGGKRFFPEGVRLDLSLVDQRRFENGILYARYVVRR